MTCTVNIIKDGNIYVAEDTWTHVASEGDSMENALLNLKEALELYYEDDEHRQNAMPDHVTATLEIA